MTDTLATTLRAPAFRGEALPVTQVDTPRLGLLMGPGQHLNPANGQRRYDLCVLDLDDPDRALTLIPMTFFGHGVCPHPVHPQRLAVFEKRGKGGCEIDLKKGGVTRPIETTAARQFYGHGAYSPDGRLLYSTETVVSGDYEGVIAVRDADTLKELGTFPSHGASPHDCRLIDDGATMVVTNGGGPMGGVAPSVTYVDVASERLLERLEFDNAAINAGHLDLGAEGGLAVVSAQREGLPDDRPGGITLRLPDGAFRTLTEPSGITGSLRGESLSVCIHRPTGVVGATTPAGNLLTFWDMNSGRLKRHYRLPNPRGIELTRDGDHFAVSYGMGNPPEALCLLDAVTLEKVDGYDLAPTGITGSHLLSYTLPPHLRA